MDPPQGGVPGAACTEKLSARISSGNLWGEVWVEACNSALPAAHQKPLFDCEKEAQAVLHDLRHMAPVDLFQVRGFASSASFSSCA